MTERDHYSDMVLEYNLSIRSRPVATFRHENTMRVFAIFSDCGNSQDWDRQLTRLRLLHYRSWTGRVRSHLIVAMR